MGIVISYDDQLGMPTSEIKLDSGEHVSLALDNQGLVIKAVARPEHPERVLFQAKPDVVAEICAGLFDDQGRAKASPLQILVSATTNLPDTVAVQRAFDSAAAAV